MTLPANMRVAVLDGKRVLLVNNSVADKASVQAQIAALDHRITVELPAQKAAISAEDLVARANAVLDTQVQEAQHLREALAGVVAQLD